MSLSPTHRRYLMIETAISIFFNTLISVPFAFLTAHGATVVPLWGAGGMAVDLIPTAFMITIVTVLIVTATARGRIRKGTVEPLPLGGGGLVERAPQRLFLRAVVVALVTALVAVPASAAVLWALGIGGLATPTFVVFKAVYGAALSIVITPPIAQGALCWQGEATAAP